MIILEVKSEYGKSKTPHNTVLINRSHFKLSNMNMKLYRGLNLDASDIEIIKNNGDSDLDKGAWLMKPKIQKHTLNPDVILSTLLDEKNDIERYPNRNTKDSKELGKYVTGCQLGSSIYSYDSNKKPLHVYLEIDVDDDNIFIDGRDFLYTIFHSLIKTKIIEEAKINFLSMVFGEKFIEYINTARKRRDEFIKLSAINSFRYVDYICMDQVVVRDHYNNHNVLIKGRYDTKFFSAFAIIGGIHANMIKKVSDSKKINRSTNLATIANYYPFESYISFEDYYKFN